VLDAVEADGGASFRRDGAGAFFRIAAVGVDLLLCSHWGRMFDFGFWMLVLPGVSMVAGRWRAGGAIRGLERGKWGVFNGKIYLGGA